MMNCKFIEDHLDEICLGELESGQHEKSINHIADCAKCRALLDEHQLYLNTMQQIEVPDLAEGKGASMIRNAIPAEPAAQDTFFFDFSKGFAAASVVFIIFIAAWLYMQNNSSGPSLSQQNGFYSTNVTLVISVPEDMPNTDLSLIIPDNVTLTGYKGSKELNWLVNLKKGANTLSLPIEIANTQNRPESFNFIAKINYKNKHKDFSLNVSL